MTHQARLVAIAALGALGAAVAAYLTVAHYAGVAPVCAASGGCETVQSSRYSEMAGVPVALIGLAGYVAITVSVLVASGERGQVARVAMAAGGVAFSGYLTYLELFVIDAICQWCVASAVIMCVLFAVTCWDFVAAPAGRGEPPAAG